MADLTGFLTQFVESVVAMPGHFADVAAHDPLSAVLLATGALFVAVSVGVFGYLSIGAFFSLFATEESAEPPRHVR